MSTIHFEKKILSRAYEKYEEQNKSCSLPRIIFNYCVVIIINAYYNYIINS